jgi:hypothetical protein
VDIYDIRFPRPFHLIALSAGLPAPICNVQVLWPATDSADPSYYAALLPTNDNVLGSIPRMHVDCREGARAGPIPLICTHSTISEGGVRNVLTGFERGIEVIGEESQRFGRGIHDICFDPRLCFIIVT